MNELLSITHIAGPKITACGRIIQRCSLCGYKLVDSRGVAVAQNEDGTFPEIGHWQVGRLVRVTDGNPTCFELLDDTDKLPDDSCLALVED
jgi:hypothetical protein